MRKLLMALSGLLFILSCSTDLQDGAKVNCNCAALNETLTINYQGTGILAGCCDEQVKFLRLVEDSRCPSDVQCPWAGRALIEISVAGTVVTLEMNKPVVIRLHNQDVMIKLEQLDPYPVSTVPLDPARYVAKIRFSS